MLQRADRGERMKRSARPGRRLLLVAIIVLLVVAIILAVAVGRLLERRTYRLTYRDEIAKWAKEFQLDPFLVAAVIHCESSNQPQAVSSSGAIGLMQIMPETGEWIAGKLAITEYTVTMLEEPAINVRFGCWYLRFLLDRYDKAIEHAVAAYNAGHGNVDTWLKDPALSKDGKLTEIPFAQTSAYVTKVMRAYEKYEDLYKDSF